MRDFYNLGPRNVRIKETGDNIVYIGELENNITVNARVNSKFGKPTLEIIGPVEENGKIENKTIVKFRYYK
ncbi:hypothetical protein [Caldicellulosiruptor naganoensis]|uniref:Uncharacterized protein n=1 Tax=Caldicellulosiruptor naganoensis TaxID=29324 RepID=A0ABY7BJT5_9FIRM|nr:hypothetical protein [Caldicellulosiruptor naganoensis]WAM32010.1 hypothetical protein OTJ99_000503 [Caldicellulosiruptor naganoensis]